MWDLRAICLAALAGFVFGALLGGFGAWKWQAGNIKDMQLAWDQAEIQSRKDHQFQQDKAIDEIQGVNDARAQALAKLAADAANRPPRVIRVCGPAVPAGPAHQGADAGHEPSTAPGALPNGGVEDPGPGRDFSTVGLHALFDEADRVSEDLRACQAGWPR